jgi:molybdopterin molybdotransferase
MIALEQALAEVRSRCRALSSVEVPLLEAHGRVLARPVRAGRDQPAQDISMMDGYALRVGGGGGEKKNNYFFSVVGEIAAGDAPWSRALGEGEAARIFTGAPVPPGADCVVMQEHVTREGASLRLADAPQPGQHIRRRGEELKAGAEALPAGVLLGPAELSLAAACGAVKLAVHARPRVAILVTGEELVPLGVEPPPGKLIETNGVALAALCREAGGEPILLGIARDDPALIAGKLRDAAADILVTTGGASVGDHDHAQNALERISGALVFHTVAIRPGKPILFGTSGDRLVFGLPGNPAAAMLGFELFVRLAVRILSGDPHPDRPRVRAKLRGSLSRIKGLTYFPRGRLTTELIFEPGGQQSSMQIASWSGANGCAVIPPGEGKLETGAEIDVLLVGPLS